mgnify:CR=1 FL=1
MGRKKKNEIEIPDEVKDLAQKVLDEEDKKGKEKEEMEEIEISTQFIWRWLFNDFLAKRFGEKWALSDYELEGLSNSIDKVLAKYMPSILAKYAIELEALTWITMILIPRLELTKRKELSKEQEKSGDTKS